MNIPSRAGIPKIQLGEGTVFYITAFLAVFFFFFTRPASETATQGKTVGPGEANS